MSELVSNIEKSLLRNQMKKDNLFEHPLSRPAPFKFDNKVAEVFDDMIVRSVPGYENVQKLSVSVAEHFSLPNLSLIHI